MKLPIEREMRKNRPLLFSFSSSSLFPSLHHYHYYHYESPEGKENGNDKHGDDKCGGGSDHRDGNTRGGRDGSDEHCSGRSDLGDDTRGDNGSNRGVDISW